MSNMSNPTAHCDKETSLRKQIFEFQMCDSDGRYSKILQMMDKAWLEFNKAYFDDSLTHAFISVTPPLSRRALADCAKESGYGGKHQIRFLPSVIDGTYDGFNIGHAIENRWLYILDILLHEETHQFVHEILNDYSRSYGGHGKAFTDKVNQIGDALGLPLVDMRRRKDKSIPISSHWPMCVRPAGYYGDLLKEPAQSTPEEPEDEPEDEPGPDWLGEAIQAFQKLTPDQHPAFFQATGYPMPSIVTVNDDKVDPPVEPEPVESKPVVKTRKVKKSTSSPVGCLSQIEVVKAIKVSFSEFKNLLEQNLFPQPDMSDKNTGTGYWSDFVIENWLKNNPATSR